MLSLSPLRFWGAAKEEKAKAAKAHAKMATAKMATAAETQNDKAGDDTSGAVERASQSASVGGDHGEAQLLQATKNATSALIKGSGSPMALYGYLRRQLVAWFLGLLAGFVGFVFLIDYMAGLDRFSYVDLAQIEILYISVMRLPFLAREVLPFALFLACMVVLSRNTRSLELVVMRSAGVSAWRFLRPFVTLSLFTGLIMMLVWDPMAKHLNQTLADDLFERYQLRISAEIGNASDAKGWYAQKLPNGFMAIKIGRQTKTPTRYRNAALMRFDGQNQFEVRYEAKTMTIQAVQLVLKDVWEMRPDSPLAFHDQLVLNLSVDLDRFIPSFAPPDALSIYELPSYTQEAARMGFRTRGYDTQWHRLLSLPLYYMALALLAACFSLRLQRKGGAALLMAAGVVAGLLAYFGRSMTVAFGATGLLPAAVAIWAPAALLFFACTVYLLSSEDG